MTSSLIRYVVRYLQRLGESIDIAKVAVAWDRKVEMALRVIRRPRNI